MLDDLEATGGGLESAIAQLVDLLTADDGVMGGLELVVDMSRAVRAYKLDSSRQACRLSGYYAEQHGLSDELWRPEVYTKMVGGWRKTNFEVGKGV